MIEYDFERSELLTLLKKAGKYRMDQDMELAR
jgi:hypothetical protein